MDRSLLVTKANSLIEASYLLDLSQQRLILLAAAKEKNQNQKGEIDGTIIITASEYAQVFKISVVTAYEEIKKAVANLMLRQVTLYFDFKGNPLNRPSVVNWVTVRSESKGVDSEHGLIALKFNPEIEPYLEDLRTNFSRYYLEYITQMSSIHAIKLYELLVNWGKNFHVHSKEIALSDLKQILAGESAYNQLCSFKKFVLDIACKQVNKFSDLECSYENKKTGRTVTHIIFHFGRKPEYEKIKITTNTPQSISKPKTKVNKPVKKEITPVAPPQAIKAISIRLADQEDWQDLAKILNLTGPYPILIKESRLISRQDNKLFIRITATAQSIWKTFKPRLEKTLSAHLGEQIEIILRTSSDEPLQRCNSNLSDIAPSCADGCPRA